MSERITHNNKYLPMKTHTLIFGVFFAFIAANPAVCETESYKDFPYGAFAVCKPFANSEETLAYCKQEYSANRDSFDLHLAQYAVLAILRGQLVSRGYELTINELQLDKPLLYKIGFVEGAVLEHLKNYSEMWTDAINKADYNNDFNSLLSITNKEYSRLGVLSALTEVKNALRESMKDYDTAKYPSTLQTYAVMAQLIALVYKPVNYET